MKALKHFFLSRQLREKVLLVGFILLGAAIWLSGVSGRVKRFWLEERGMRDNLAFQASVIQSGGVIQARTDQAIAKLDPARTLNDTRLFTVVEELARTAGLRNVSINPETARSTSQFAIYSLSLQATRSGWEPIRAFYAALQKRSPYVSLEEFVITTAAGAPPDQGHNLRLRVSSVEVAR